MSQAERRNWITIFELAGFVPLVVIAVMAFQLGQNPDLRRKMPPMVERPKPVAAAPAPVEAVKAAGPAAVVATPEPVAAAGTYVVSGVVKLEGSAPAGKTIDMAADPKCANMHAAAPAHAEEVVAGAGGELANVFVRVTKGIKKNPPPPKSPATIEQKGCQYLPHVLGVMVGQDMNIVNGDETLHNIHCLAKENEEFNFGQPTPGTRPKKFRKPEKAIKLKCDVHPWMGAYVWVMDHPYYGVSGKDGAFKIVGLEPGTYTIEAWHEKFGTMEKEIKVEAADLGSQDFAFKAQ